MLASVRIDRGCLRPATQQPADSGRRCEYYVGDGGTWCVRSCPPTDLCADTDNLKGPDMLCVPACPAVVPFYAATESGTDQECARAACVRLRHETLQYPYRCALTPMAEISTVSDGTIILLGDRCRVPPARHCGRGQMQGGAVEHVPWKN